ncbi:MAG: hypothetical protein PHC51_04560 [bacterium]|nr:hypothetical protein [bacterium]
MKNSLVFLLLALSGSMLAFNATAESAHGRHDRGNAPVSIVIDADVRVFAEPYGSCAFMDDAVGYYPGDTFLYKLGVPLDLGPLGTFSPCFVTEITGSASLASNPSVKFSLEGKAISAQHFNPLPQLDGNGDYLAITVDESGVPRMASTAGSVLFARLTPVDRSGRGLVPGKIEIAFRDTFFAALPGMNTSSASDDIETLVPTALSPTRAYGALTIQADQATSVEFNSNGAVLFLTGRISGPLAIYPDKGK